jgi:DNA anti-recombination protein RmuC
MEEAILKTIAQAGILGAIVAFMLYKGAELFKQFMADAKAREEQLFAEAMAREERILNETRAREDRLASERQASDKQAQENQNRFLEALETTTAQFSEVCKGVEDLKGRVGGVEDKVDHISKDVGTLLVAAVARGEIHS